jgi:hypothetical protein
MSIVSNAHSCSVLLIGIVLTPIRNRIGISIFFYADPGRERHQNDAGPHADPAPSFTHAGIPEIRVLTYIHSSANPFGFILLLIDTDPEDDRTIPIQIRQNDADPTRSGSTTHIIPFTF